jgi:hypothetical protein
MNEQLLDTEPTYSGRRACILIAALVALCFVGAAFAAAARAVSNSEELGEFASDGSGAAQIKPSFIATSPVTGHVFLADAENRRVDEFTAWGQFVMAWGWGVADGSPEMETCGPAEPEYSPPASLCRAGIAGAGAGQLMGPEFIAVDAAGDVYVSERANNRVQKFSPSGEFILMFGGGVDKTTGGNVCTAASGDECQGGSPGTGPEEFSEELPLAISNVGTVLVGDGGRVQQFGLDGSFQSQFNVSGVGAVSGLAADPTEAALYVTVRRFGATKEPQENQILKFDLSGTELLSISLVQPSFLAVDGSGNLFVRKEGLEGLPPEIVEFDSSGTDVAHCCSLSGIGPDALGANAVGDLYINNRAGGSIRFYGPPPISYPPVPPIPPEISDQFLASAGSTTATLKARIDPNFWADTHYFIEYGPEPCASSTCIQSDSAELGAGAVKKPVTTAGVELTGLAPGTTYHYRFVAQSGGGGPTAASDATFTTFAELGPQPACANDPLRIGPAATLPDCRAYEMVSPVDKNGGDIRTLTDSSEFQTRFDQAAVSGDGLAYSTYAIFGDPEGGPFSSEYLARRGPEGWSGQNLSAPRDGNFYNTAVLENEFKAFSPDLCEGWLATQADPVLAPGAVAGFPNLYRRPLCGGTAYEALTTAEPSPARLPKHYFPELEGRSADGSTAIFHVDANLGADSPAQPGGCTPEGGQCVGRVYEATPGGGLRYVCIFPEGTAAKVEAELPSCSAGTPNSAGVEVFANRYSQVSHAMSEDGSRIYWSAAKPPATGESAFPGRIYLRVDGSETLPVSETQTTKPARFFGASPDGSRALFEVEDPGSPPTAKNKNLYLYEFGEEVPSSRPPIAGKVLGVAATSEDLSRVYFVSEEKLGEPNSESASAVAGRQNLYLWEDGTEAVTFIATLSKEDATGLISDASPIPIDHVAIATPNGSRLAFRSSEPLTGFDNDDAVSAEADAEVFTYDALSGRLSCASCSPAGARPAGRELLNNGSASETGPWTAAFLPGAENQLYTTKSLAADGSRLFFTSFADLLPGDTNDKADVYEWETPGSSPSCADESSPNYYAANDGCLFLISTGTSDSDSAFVDSAANGRDVFFTTGQSLLPQDPDQIDVYDAREGGGFPPAPEAPEPCTGEGCQGPAAAAPGQTSPQSTAPGPGNPPRPRCPKGKVRSVRKGKEVCAKKQPKRHHKTRKAHHHKKKSGNDKKAGRR